MGRLSRLIGAGAMLALVAACSADRDPSVAPTTAPVAVASTAPPIPVESVAMVGDSITVGSMEALELGFETLDLDEVEIDAESGRRMVREGTMASGVMAVSGLVDDDPPDLWVIALGTNDVANYGPDEYRSAITELLAAVPADAPLVWVDTYLDEHQEESATFNVALRAVLAERGLATVVDWAEIASEDGVLDDGVHPSGFGIDEFTRRVVGAVGDWM